MSTIHTGLARLLLQCLVQSGVDVMSVYGRDEIGLLARLSSEARVPLAVWDDMVARAEQALHDTDVALKLAAFIGPMDKGALGFITMASRDIQEAAQSFAKLYPLLSDAYALDVFMSDGRLATRMQPLASQRSHYLEKFTLGSICRHARWLVTRPELRFDAHFAFAHPAGTLLPQYRDTFGGDVRFGMPYSALYRPPGMERLRVSRNGRTVKELLWSTMAGNIAMPRATGSDWPQKVEQVVAHRLRSGDVRIEGSAEDLGMSVRTLQVRLKECGASFRVILDKARHRQALALLEEGSLPLVDIATRLGFSSQSSFTRAFHRWAGMSPGAYQTQRGLKAGKKTAS